MDMARLQKLSEFAWRIPRSGAMRVPVIIYGDEGLIRDMDEKVREQAVNVATLPGIVGASYAMPDAHWGYGFPIGGVAAFDPAEGGVISAGGVGFDISCGVRTLLTGIKCADIEPIKVQIADALFAAVPAGLGSTGRIRLSEHEMDAMLEGGDTDGKTTWTGSRNMAEWKALAPIAFRSAQNFASARRWGRWVPAIITSKSRKWPGCSTKKQGGPSVSRKAMSSSPSIADRAGWATRSAPNSCAKW
jgi:hypothetical protein